MNYSIATEKMPAKRAGSKTIVSGAPVAEGTGLTSDKIEKVIKKALVQLPALTTVAVVEVATGNCLAYQSQMRHFDPAIAANNAEMVRQKQLVASKMRGERLEDILVPFRKQFHLIRLAKNGQWFVYLEVQAQDTSLAMAREILKSIIG